MKKAFVIGHPIAHSRSPLIHNFWLDELSIQGSYEKIDVAPADLEQFLQAAQNDGFVGGNVTIPHKEAARSLAANVTEIAGTLGAANTLYIGENGWDATNTDGYGFLANLDAEAPGWDNQKSNAVIIGAGGASRAIIYALLQRGFAKIHLLNRTLSRAEQLADIFGPRIHPAALDTLPNHLSDANILVNTSSMGMQGQPPLTIDLSQLNKTALVTDIVYTPLVTGLLKAADAQGNPTVDGLGMLLHQAVPGFEKWFGARPTVSKALRTHILHHINSSNAQ